MNKIIFVALGLTVLSQTGCSNAENSIQSQPKKIHENTAINKTVAEAHKLTIVFKKSVSIETAKNELQEAGIKILKVYTSISKSSGKPMIYVSSPYNSSKIRSLLKNVESVEEEQTILLEPDPNKPQ